MTPDTVLLVIAVAAVLVLTALRETGEWSGR